MKIRFLREFGGRETHEIHYPEGAEIETGYPFTDSVARDLFERGIIVYVEPIEQEAPAVEVKRRKGKNA